MSAKMQFNPMRFLGIVFVGVAALFLAIIAGPYHWDSAMQYFMQDAGNIATIYFLFLISGAFFLSLEIRQADKSIPQQENE